MTGNQILAENAINSHADNYLSKMRHFLGRVGCVVGSIYRRRKKQMDPGSFVLLQETYALKCFQLGSYHERTYTQTLLLYIGIWENNFCLSTLTPTKLCFLIVEFRQFLRLR